MAGGMSGGSSFIVPGRRIRAFFFGWSVAEIVAFIVVVKSFGLGAAILLTGASSLLGMVQLRRVGIEAVQQVRGAMMGAPGPQGMVDGTLAGLGALLLILPGFVSDAAGLALASPSLRRSIATRFGFAGAGAPVDNVAPPRRRSPDVIDLAPEDWIVVDKTRGQPADR